MGFFNLFLGWLLDRCKNWTIGSGPNKPCAMQPSMQSLPAEISRDFFRNFMGFAAHELCQQLAPGKTPQWSSSWHQWDLVAAVSPAFRLVPVEKRPNSPGAVKSTIKFQGAASCTESSYHVHILHQVDIIAIMSTNDHEMSSRTWKQVLRHIDLLQMLCSNVSSAQPNCTSFPQYTEVPTNCKYM